VVPAGGAAQVTFHLKPRPWPIISVDAPKIVLVRHDYQGKPKPGVKPHRIPVKLSFGGDHDGDGEFNSNHADHIVVFEKADDAEDKAKRLPWNIKAADLKDKTVFIEGKAPSASMQDTQLTLTLKNGSAPPKNNPATEKITCILLELDIFKWRPDDGSDPVQIGEGPKIDPGRAVLVQNTHLWAQRAKMVLAKAKPATYAKDLVIKPIHTGAGVVAAFAHDMEKPAPGQAELTGAGLTFPNGPIDAAKGVILWVQGKHLSGTMSDTGWTVELEELPGHEGDRVTMTAIQAEIDLFKSRTDTPAKIPLPAAFSDSDKFDKGRFVHLQDTGPHHGRGMILVKKVKPDGFVGTLVLNPYDATQTPTYSATKSVAPKTKVFDDEVPAGGQHAKAFPVEIDHPAGYPAAGKAFWVEGGAVSGALRDAELRLGVKEVDTGCDRVEFTVVKFKKIQADIPSTPAHQVRDGADGGPSNSPVPRHTLLLANPPTADNYDEDFTKNQPLVLIEDSVPNSD
jgi:hypothetical protein